MGSHHYHEPVYRIVSHRIRIVHRISYRVASHPYRIRLVSYRLTSQRTVSCRIATYLYRVVSCRIVIAIVSHRTVSWSYRIRNVSVSSHEPAYRIASCLIATVIVSCPYRIRSIVSRTIVPHRIVSYPRSVLRSDCFFFVFCVLCFVLLFWVLCFVFCSLYFTFCILCFVFCGFLVCGLWFVVYFLCIMFSV